jgi:hypothetical protein
MDGQEPVDTVPAYQPGPQWLCKNCGTFNVDGTTHCSECGFVRGYDPATEEAVTHGELPPRMAAAVAAAAAPPGLATYLLAAQLGVTILILGLLAPAVLRLYQNWPVQSPYEREAGELGVGLLTLQARIDQGLSKGQYEELLASLLGEEAGFRAAFAARPEHARESYQNLVQAAEYYGLAGDAWETQLAGANMPLTLQGQASSKDAEKAVKQYWDRAKLDALAAMRGL